MPGNKIPKELQDLLDEHTKKWKAHCEEEFEHLKQYFDTVNSLLETNTENCKKHGETTISQSDWNILMDLFNSMNGHIEEFRQRCGTKCADCQDWIAEKLKKEAEK